MEIPAERCVDIYGNPIDLSGVNNPTGTPSYIPTSQQQQYDYILNRGRGY